MSVHHLEQALDVFEFLLRRHILVLIHLGDFAGAHFGQDLLRLLLSENYDGVGFSNCLHLDTVCLHLRLLDHLAHRLTRFLIKCVLEELLLEPKVLELLFLLPFALQVILSVKLFQLAHLLLLGLLGRNILEDSFPCSDFTLVSVVFAF